MNTPDTLVPFLDLKAQYADLREEIDRAIREVTESTCFSNGPFVEKFEEEFASFCGCRYAIGVGSGSDALWLSLTAAGIGEGHEVITVPNTFIATAEAILRCGAKPVFVDIDPHTFTMDVTLIANAITERTAAILPVHLFGHPADMDPILETARQHGLLVIEDACQAHGATYKGRPAGSMGIAGCFSFYPGKNLGAYGEAGAVTTDSEEIMHLIKMMRNHGEIQKYHHEISGWNARMDSLQAAVLSVKLKHLSRWNRARSAHAGTYRSMLKTIPEVRAPGAAGYAEHIYHLYGIRTPERNALMRSLAHAGVTCGIHYPVPLHLQNAFKRFGLEQGSFPVAEQCAEELLSLPMFPEMTSHQIEHVAEAIDCFFHENSSYRAGSEDLSIPARG